MSLTGILVAIVVGAIVGVLARLVLPGRQNISLLLTVVVGIVAAVLGQIIADALNVGSTNGIDWIKLLIQVALAAIGVSILAGTSRSRSIR